MTSGGLHDLARVAVAAHQDQALMVHVFEDGDLVVHRQDRVVVAPQELLLQDFDGDLFTGLEAAAHVDL